MSNKTETKTHLEEVIDSTLTYLESLQPDTDEFEKTVDQLTKLHAMVPKKEPFMKPDQLVTLLANLGGIVAILGYEQTHVITSKALGFVPKLHL